MQSSPVPEVGMYSWQRDHPFFFPPKRVRYKQKQSLNLYASPTGRTALTGFNTSLPLSSSSERFVEQRLGPGSENCGELISPYRNWFWTITYKRLQTYCELRGCWSMVYLSVEDISLYWFWLFNSRTPDEKLNYITHNAAEKAPSIETTK